MATPPVRVKRPIRKAKRFVERVTTILQRVRHASIITGDINLYVWPSKQGSAEAKMGITVSDVFLGGSLGQGTRIPQHFDIDLIVFSPSKYTYVL